MTLRCRVLGATGFVGGQIARAASERGWTVRGLRRRPKAVGAIGELDVAWVEGDLRNRPSLIRVTEGCDIVFHAAAYYPHGTSGTWEAVRRGVTEMRNAGRSAGGISWAGTTSASGSFSRQLPWLPGESRRG